jgi:uncharacterized protein YndB with AHSA1/START domain
LVFRHGSTQDRRGVGKVCQLDSKGNRTEAEDDQYCVSMGRARLRRYDRVELQRSRALMRIFRRWRPKGVETLTLERELPAPPAAVYAAFTDAEALMRWLRPFGAEPVAAAVDFESGDWFRIELAGRRGRWVISGKYLEAEPPRRLRFSWESPVTYDRPTLVTLTILGLGADAATSRLELVHERLAGALSAERHEAFWADVLDRLADDLAARARADRPLQPRAAD